MARTSICTILQVKPFSGYYQSCPTCKRKLGTVEFNSVQQQKSRYWCRNCHVDWSAKELGLCYCLILTVTDYCGSMMVVSLFGRTLETIFGLPATQMHKHLNVIEVSGTARYELILNALRTLLIGACVELTFARSFDISRAGNGRTTKMNHYVASGVKILGTNSNETVLSLLTTQTSMLHKSAASSFVRQEQKDKTSSSTAVKDSSLLTQQNSLIPRHDHDSSSFLYDTDSQTQDTITQRTSCPLHIKLESFLDTQSARGPSEFHSDSVVLCVDDVPDVENSQQIICELESEWEAGSQQSQHHHEQQLPDVDFDLALSEDVLSELQETFDLSRDIEPSPPSATIASKTSCSLAIAADTGVITPLSSFMGNGANSWRSSTTNTCYGSPELFSSYKRSQKKQTQTHQGRLGELSEPSSSFSPELFGPTPLVCRYSGPPATHRILATPSGLRSKVHTPKRSLLQFDSTLATPLSHATVSQVTSESTNSSRLIKSNICTPQTQSKQSNTVSCTASSPDLFS